jgi:hypothetical protein
MQGLPHESAVAASCEHQAAVEVEAAGRWSKTIMTQAEIEAELENLNKRERCCSTL